MITSFIKNIILETFYPRRCVNCGAFGQVVCINCARQVEICQTSVCPECGKITLNCAYCRACKRRLKTALYGIFIASNYDRGPIKELIHHLKYSGFLELALIIGEIMYQRIAKINFSNNCVIVPVPMFKKREITRGFNQAELLARYISNKLNKPGGLALERVINTKTQVGLSKKERINNIKGSIQCVDRELIFGKMVILVDDVVTTGATLSECARVLKESGAKRVYGLVSAKRS